MLPRVDSGYMQRHESTPVPASGNGIPECWFAGLKQICHGDMERTAVLPSSGIPFFAAVALVRSTTCCQRH